MSTPKDRGALDSEGANKGPIIRLARNPGAPDPTLCSGPHQQASLEKDSQVSHSDHQDLSASTKDRSY